MIVIFEAIILIVGVYIWNRHKEREMLWFSGVMGVLIVLNVIQYLSAMYLHLDDRFRLIEQYVYLIVTGAALLLLVGLLIKILLGKR